MITVDLAGETLRVNILKADTFQADLQTVKDIPGRKWNGELWEFPWYQLGDILEAFGNREILFKSDVVKDLADRLQFSLIPWRKLGSSFEEIAFTKFPKPFQERYVRINSSRNRTLCSFDQGTGKTYTSLERAKFLGVQRLLIVCPKVVCANWKAEAREVFAKEAIIYQGTKPQRAKTAQTISSEVDRPVICTYETAYEIAGMIDGGLPIFDQIIIDEAHLISNPTSKRFNETVNLVRKNKKAGIQCLTGTPMQHRIKDIWAILYILNPLVAGGYEAFTQRYMKPIRFKEVTFTLRGKNGKPIFDDKGKPLTKTVIKEIAWRPINLPKFEVLMDSISYRVKREDVVSFDDQVDTVTVELTDRQRRLYNRLCDEMMVELSEKRLNLRHVPVRLLRLLQAAEGLFNFEENNWESGKLEYIRHVLDNTDDKVIIWSRFKPITDILGSLYSEQSVVYNGSRTDGYKQFAKWSFNGIDHQNDLEEFQKLSKRHTKEEKEPGWAQFFFGTIDMRSSLGMNLHQDCSRQIFSSFSWQGAANMQAADRLRRIGQKSERVRTDFLVAENTFEAKALSTVLSNFKDTMEALDGRQGISFKKVEQMLGILKDARLRP